MPGPATYDPDYDLSRDSHRVEPEGIATTTTGASDIDPWEARELIEANEEGDA